MALATAKQLWRLNKEGRLALLARGLDVEPLTPEQADAAIKEKVEAGEAYDRRGIGGLALPSVLTGSDLKQRRISSSASGNRRRIHAHTSPDHPCHSCAKSTQSRMNAGQTVRPSASRAEACRRRGVGG